MGEGRGRGRGGTAAQHDAKPATDGPGVCGELVCCRGDAIRDVPQLLSHGVESQTHKGVALLWMHVADH